MTGYTVVTSSAKGTSRFQLKGFTVWVILVAASITVGATVSGLFLLLRNGHFFAERTYARAVHRRGVSRTARLAKQSGQLQAQLNEFYRFNDQVRAIFGVKGIAWDQRRVGVGGIGSQPGTGNGLADLRRQAGFEEWSMRNTFTRISERMRLFAHMPLVSPAYGKITSRFGVRVHPILERTHFHQGIDIANLIGSFVRASGKGVATKVGYDEFAGRYIKIHHGHGYESMYAHLEDIFVKEGDRVDRFQAIGTLGNTGRSTGPHVHYEIRKYGRAVDPEEHILPLDIVVD